MKIDFGNVQGLIVHHYRRPVARYLLFRFGSAAGGRGFLQHTIDRVTMADCASDSAADPLLNIGITVQGLQALGVPESMLAKLDATYRRGPEPGPLGDVPGSRSDPAQWWE